MEIYIKGKYEDGVGSAAYVIVESGKEVVHGARRLGAEFTLCGQTFPCDQFNTEVLAAICGMARIGEERLVNVYSNNKSVIAWLLRGGEPEGRTSLLDVWRRYADGKSVLVEWIPFFERDPSGNEWNRLCCQLASKALEDE